MPTIVIDAGHGGYDPGAVSGTRYEKNDNLRMAQAVANRLRALGYNVVMTRDGDTYVTLSQRSNISNNANADYFVSLHRNAAANPIYNGMQTFVYTTPSERSVVLANNLQNRLVAAGVQSNLGVSRANYSVLRQTNAPSALLELGFISNVTDNVMFDNRFNAYADAIVQGIVDTVPIAPPPSDRRERTRVIQQTLNNRYGTGLSTDGIFGALTKRAIIRGIQSELNRMYGAGLVVDGVWGPRTNGAIRALSNGARNNLVYLLQALLFFAGSNLTVDGIFGNGTEAAVRNFQAQRGLTVDGVAGRNTFEALINSI